MSFGSRLKKARENKKLSQLDVSQKTNVNNRTLSRYENDGAEPDFETLKLLADLYGVSVQYLLTGNNSEEEIDYSYDLEELLEDKTLTWKNEVLTDEEKKKAIEILNILLNGKKRH